MAQWGSQDVTSNSVIWAPATVSLTPNVANRDLMYGNTTGDAFITGQTIGMFGVGKEEMTYGSAGKRAVASVTVNDPGTGWTEIPTVDIANAAGDTTGTGATGTANATVVEVALNGPGTGGTYIPGEVLTITSGTGTKATTTVTHTEIRTAPDIVVAGTGYVNTDVVSMTTGTGTQATFTVTTGAADTIPASLALTTRGDYTVNPTSMTAAVTSNVSGVGVGLTITCNTRIKTIELTTGGVYTALPGDLSAEPTTGSATGTGATIDTTIGVGPVQVTDGGSGFTLPAKITFGGAGGSGANATGILATSSSAGAVAHTGWIKRTVGSGGRAGRVQTEVLVAGGIITDASDDAIYPE